MANVKGGGEVQILALDLYHPYINNVPSTKKSKDFLDLLDVFAQFTIYDSILTPFQSAEILINDSNDMVPDYPIIGGNILHIKYNVKEGPKETEISQYFRVTKVKNIVINERKQSFTLNLISEAGWHNMHTSLSTAFKGSPSDIIKTVFDNYIYGPSGTKKNISLDGSAGNLKLVCPRWKPSQVIKWVTDKAIDLDDDMPGLFFFETNTGFRFLSLATMLDKGKNVPITDTMGETKSDRKEGKLTKGYLFKIPGVPTYGADGKPQSGMVGSETTQNIDDFRVFTRANVGEDVVNGHLFSKHITHDIFHKSLTTNEYNYFKEMDGEYPKRTRLSNSPQYYGDGPEPHDPNVKVSVSPRQTKMHSLTKNQPGDRTLWADDYGLMRKHMMNQINDMVISNFQVPGTNLIEAGRLLEFNYPAIRKIEGNDDVYQKKYTGLYLIRDCIHIFKPIGNATATYKVDMNIVRDGF